MMLSVFFLFLLLLQSFTFCSSNETTEAEIKSALDAIIRGSNNEDFDEIHAATDRFFQTFNSVLMTPDNDEFLMATLDSFHDIVAPYYAEEPELNFEKCFRAVVLNKIPLDNLEGYHEDALEILSDYLCYIIEAFISDKRLQDKVLDVLLICYSRVPDDEIGDKFVERFDALADLLNDDEADVLADHIAENFASNDMMIPKSWLTHDSAYIDVFEAIFESLLEMIEKDLEENKNKAGGVHDNVVIDPKYFFSIAPLAIVKHEVKLIGLIAKVLPHFEAGAFLNSKKELEKFVFACRAILPAEEALPVVEYFIGSEYFEIGVETVALLHFTCKPVPEEFKADLERYERFISEINNAMDTLLRFKGFNITNEEKHQILKASDLLFYRTKPRLLTREILVSVEKLQDHLIPIFKSVAFSAEFCNDSSIVSCILGFLLRADSYIPIKPEVAYIFIDAVSSRVQYYFKKEASMPKASHVWKGLEYFKIYIDAAFLKISTHAIHYPNTLSVNLILKGFMLVNRFNLKCDNIWMDAVMFDESSTPEMWALVHSHMKFGYGDVNIVFASFLYWHLSRKITASRRQFIAKLISFYRERAIISATDLDFANLVLSNSE